MTSAYADSNDELQQDIAVPVEHPADDVEPGARAVIYLRVSSTGQVKTDYDPEGISIPAQREACLRKAKDLGLTVIDEYVEPGRSATEMTKREAFQRMLARVRAQGDVDYVIVYMLSRMARNRYDDAIVMADLRKRGVTLVSATEAVDDSPVGQLMHGILATFNEYQSRQSGADIANKMGQKARTGGTLGRAKIGYLNHIDHSDGRVIRTIVLDDERAPFVQLAFELYDTGNYTLDELADELYDRGLRTRPTAKHPAKKVSINKLSQMLRDRYYIGYVTYKGEEVRGRHDPLIDEDLFDRVQDRINARSAAKERRRVHHHYLKGSLFCGRCRRARVTQRMIIQRTVNSKGAEYLYFFCRNRQNSTCDAPHVNAELVEDAIERHYATIRFSQAFISDVRTQIDTVISEQEKSARLLHQQLSTQLAELDTQEENLIDLAADGTLPQTKVKAKLRDIERQRRHLNQRLDTASADLTDAARLIDVSLKLLERPEELYRRCNDEQRRLLNQAIFHNIYIEDEEVTDHDLQEPFSQLHAIQQTQRSTRDAQHNMPAIPEPRDSKRATRQAGGPSSPSGVAVLLQGLQSGTCSSNTSKVELRGIEPLTFSMRTRRATNCATAPFSECCCSLAGRRQHSEHPPRLRAGGSFAHRTAVRLPGALVEFVEHGVFVVDLDDHRVGAAPVVAAGLVVVSVVRGGLGRFVVVRLAVVRVGFVAGLGHAGEPPIPDVLFDPHLPPQVGEVADVAEVDHAVQPPGRGPGEGGEQCGRDGGGHDEQQDALPAGVLGARGQRRGFRVVAAAAGPVAAAGADVVAVDRPPLLVLLVGYVVEVGFDVVVVPVGVGHAVRLLRPVGFRVAGFRGCPVAASAHHSCRQR